MRAVSNSNSNDFTASRIWRDELDVVRGFRDKLDMSVDSGIECTVVALRLLGFKTTMSCAGHLDRRTTGPYVMFESKAAKEFIQKAHEPTTSDGQHTIRESQKIAQLEADSLRRLIESFNHERAVTGFHPLLELRPVGPSGLRLCFVHADFDGIRELKSYRALIGERRAEMQHFTQTMIHVLATQSDAA